MTRTIVVTGAASGIGAAVRTLLQDRGDEVIGVDLRGSDIDADLSSPDGRAAVVARIEERCPDGLDGIVTSAGTSIPGVAMITVNYFGTTALVAALRPLLARSSAPRVALVGSVSGTHPADADTVAACLAGDEPAAIAAAEQVIEAGRSHELYPSSKSAVAQWARRTATEPGWADAGIGINVVAPGVVLTPMTEGLLHDDRMRAVMDQAVPMPLNGHASPEVIARALGFFVGEDNTHITGQVLYVDGGAEVTLRAAAHF